METDAKMRVNKKLIPIKVHYFCLLGGASTVIPFIMVIAVQLGVPVFISGTLNAISLVMVFILKPVMATLADIFPSFRRGIFLLNMCFAVVFMGAIYFVPSMQDVPYLHGELLKVKRSANDSEGSYLFSGKNLRDRYSGMEERDGGCHIVRASDCLARCGECSISTVRLNLEGHSPVGEGSQEILHMNTTKEEPPGGGIQHFWVEGLQSSEEWENISIECPRPEWEGAACPGVLSRWEFWLFAALLIVLNVSLSTVLSFTDAVIMDTIGKDGNYGAQRAWGTLGWGLISPIAGVLIDLWSGSTLDKNLAPAFILGVSLWLINVILAAVFIQVPKIKSDKPVLKEVLPLLCKPYFMVFSVFIMLNGAFDGICVYFLLLMQEEMAIGTSDMDSVRVLQGVTLFVQCSLEAPLMFVNHWFMQRFGAQRVISFVFFLYIIRFFALAMTGMWGPIWSTLVVELLNGPCYGLGFTAVVVYAASVSPPGTSTTVQSVVNVLYESCGYAFALLLGGLMCEAMGCPYMYLLLGGFSVVVFLLQVISLFLFPAQDAEKKSKQVTGDKDFQDSKINNETKDSEARKRVSKEEDEIIEETHL